MSVFEEGEFEPLLTGEPLIPDLRRYHDENRHVAPVRYNYLMSPKNRSSVGTAFDESKLYMSISSLLRNLAMMSSDSESGETGGVSRRTVLQGLGTGAVASVALGGSVSGHEVQGRPVFCGCSQLCVCVEGNADVLMAQENDEGGYDVGFLRDGELVPYPEGESPYGGNFCVSTDDENVPDGKIIGLQVAGTRWVNPNQCAQKALEAEQEQLDSTHPRPEGDSGGPCGKPPCEHPGGGKGRRR